MLARTAQGAAQRWAAAAATASGARALATGPTSNQYPPPDPSRLGTADLCDVHHPVRRQLATRVSPELKARG